jgi:hypothetical protein
MRLEGKLAGPWVQELMNCWQGTLAQGATEVRIDLSALTFINPSGKELLAAMHMQGVQFIASGCWAKGIVAEITNGKTT